MRDELAGRSQPLDVRATRARSRASSASARSTASVLVRRGLRRARRGARASSTPSFPATTRSCSATWRPPSSGSARRSRAATRICVHGDYDVDGICATALAVLVLRELGADVVWHLPSRFEEGYGVSRETLARLADEGVGLVLTVDCGITAVEEVAEAKAARPRGRRHRPPPAGRGAARLPDRRDAAVELPVPRALRHGRRLQARRGAPRRRPPGGSRGNLDLVALATIADVVPLVDENRALAIAGLRALARTQRPGLQALMRERARRSGRGRRGRRRLPARAADQRGRPARPARRRARARADRATPTRRGVCADELEELNRDRQAVEDRILREAIAAVDAWPEPRRRRRGYVALGRGLARGRDRDRRLAPRRALPPAGRPHRAVARATGRARAARSPSFDLHGALAACSDHLERFGGHRAAAGLSIDPKRTSTAFADAFAAHADAQLGHEDLVRGRCRSTRSSRRATHARPRGGARAARAVRPRQPGRHAARPGDARPSTPATVGEGKHLRFRVRQHGRDAGSAIAFGQGSQLDRLRAVGLFDVAFRLKENHWNGTVAPQLVVRRIFDTAEGYEELRAAFAELWRRGEPAWTPEARRVFGELALDAEAARPRPAPRVGVVPSASPRRGAAARGVTVSRGPGETARAHRAWQVRGAARSRRRHQRRRLLMDRPSSRARASPPSRARRVTKPRSVH